MDLVFFLTFAFIAVACALNMALQKHPVSSALSLIGVMVSLAVLYVLLGAEFIAGVQILVYVGGVMVLFLFVIMLVNVGAEERGGQVLNKPRQVTVSMVFCLLLVLGLLFAINVGYKGLQTRDEKVIASAQALRQGQQQDLHRSATGTSRITNDTQRVGNSLYRFASLPFEIASVLLLVAIIGSVMLARTLKQEAAVDDLAPDVRAAEAARDPELAETPPPIS